MTKFYLTTPIYYVNDIPHIGHAYTTVAGDILARWMRLQKKKTFFLTGTDEHGQKIFQAATNQNITPEEYCNRVVKHFLNSWEKLNISYDYFIRTTDEKHIQTVKYVYARLKEKNLIYKKKYQGLYCVGCEKFLSSDDLINGLCPDHKQPPILHQEENYFFRLGNYRKQLQEIIERGDPEMGLVIEPPARRNEILGKLTSGLEDISISRTNLAWGIPLPFDENQTAYVWVDALINYISALGYGQKTPKNFLEFWPADLHLMAKDILWFHAVIWPAILLALDLPLPKKIFAHGFFTVNGQKMSKTLGNVISPEELTNRFGVDGSRYLLMAMFPFGTDGDINLAAMVEKYNNDLANNLGNLFRRTLSMVEKYFDFKIPRATIDTNLIDSVEKKFQNVFNSLENTNPSGAVGYLTEVIDIANRYIQENSPWTLAKTSPQKLARVLISLLQVLGRLSIYFYPFIPKTATKMFSSLGYEQNLWEVASEYFSGKEKKLELPNRTNPAEIFFPRLQK